MTVAAIVTRGVGFHDDDDEPLVPISNPTAYSGTKLPDGRTLGWREYGNPRGVPCVLIPDSRSSRLAPEWLLHDSALPDGVRLITVDRPGTGVSDAVGFGGDDDPADDLARVVNTLAVGRVVFIGVGSGADAALAVADKYPDLVTAVMAVSLRVTADKSEHARRRHRFARHQPVPWAGPLDAWSRAAGKGNLLDAATWERAVKRMEPQARQSLGDRWQHEDFRQAVVADLAETTDDWVHTSTPQAGRWISEWNADVPVYCWHGRDETGTSVSELRDVAAKRGHWTVMPVSGCGALLGSWPAILTSARDGYLASIVR